MSCITKLGDIIGKRGRVNVQAPVGERAVTFLSYTLGPNVVAETDLETAITQSEFTVHFDDFLIDSKTANVIPGCFISMIDDFYDPAV